VSSAQADEIKKWLGERIVPLALAEVTRDEAVRKITAFLTTSAYPLLIISYETFRIHAERFHAAPDACDLLICDEAHRLKNEATLTNQALGKLTCLRRVLLSGTPMQNDLDEFFAMVDFTNPGILGEGAAFRRRFSGPILAGREPSATEKQRKAGEEAGNELSRVVNQFILRRTNTLLSKHLPPKLLQVVCVRMSELQRNLYAAFLGSVAVANTMSGKSTGVLTHITALRKLINHPRLAHDVVRAKQAAGGGARGGGGQLTGEAAGFDSCQHLFPSHWDKDRTGCDPDASGKFFLAAKMLAQMRVAPARERIVIVSVSRRAARCRRAAPRSASSARRAGPSDARCRPFPVIPPSCPLRPPAPAGLHANA
jgi:DNA repair and recombination RAD54-like protein